MTAPRGLQLRFREGVPRGAFSAAAGSPEFYAWCAAGEARARGRRQALHRAWRRYERVRDTDTYPAALIVCQRLGVALEDLARLLIALGADEPWPALRGARIDEMDEVFERLTADAEAARAVFRLPSSETIDARQVPDGEREALLGASDAAARSWHAQLSSCAAGWLLLRHIAKAMRHGAPLLSRELVLDAPGAGVLGAGATDPFDRWVLLVPTTAGDSDGSFTTRSTPADLSHDTLRRARQAGLEGIALARELAGSHVTRVTTESVWALPEDVIRRLHPHHRAVLRAQRR